MGDLQDYLSGLGRMLDPVELLVRDSSEGVGWSVIVDVDRCPNQYLDWLAQWVGVVIPQGLTTEQRRERVKSTDGWSRGSVQAIKSAPLPYLSGSRTVILSERDSSPYHFTVATLKSETPESDWGVNNVLTNPSFETDTSDWTEVGSTLTQNLTEQYDGNAAGRIVTDNAGANEGVSVDFVPIRSGKHTASIYAKGSGTIRLRLTDDLDVDIIVGIGVVLDSDWQRLVLTTDTNMLLGSTYRLYVETTAMSSVTFYIDAAQVEQTKTVSPFYPGIRPAGQGLVGTALRAQKPGALIMNYIVIDGQTYRQLRDTHDDYQDVKDSYGTYEEVRDDIPL